MSEENIMREQDQKKVEQYRFKNAVMDLEKQILVVMKEAYRLMHCTEEKQYSDAIGHCFHSISRSAAELKKIYEN